MFIEKVKVKVKVKIEPGLLEFSLVVTWADSGREFKAGTASFLRIRTEVGREDGVVGAGVVGAGVDGVEQAVGVS